jgi:hypothetical protein
MSALADLQVRSRMEPLFWLAFVWLFFAATEARR